MHDDDNNNSVNQRSPTIMSEPPRKIGPRVAIQRNTTDLQETTKSDRNVTMTKRYWSNGGNPESNKTTKLSNPEDKKNVATSFPREKTVIYPQGDSYISTIR